MNELVLSVPAWRKSSHSGADSGCVEVAGKSQQGFVFVRDSKDMVGPALAFPIKEWKRFIIRLKGDEFDWNTPR
jgi:hypothetical protein